MSPVELLATLAPEFDRPATPRAVFAEGLWSRLDSELRSSSSARVAQSRSWRSWLGPFVGSPRRIAILVALVLLFVSGVAMATYLGVRSWVTTSPRGVQVRNDFHVTRVVAPSKTLGWFWGTALSTDGHELYFVPDSGMVYRVREVDSNHPSAPQLYFNPNDVGTRAFLGSGPLWQKVATAPGGDLFVLGQGTWGGGDRHRLSAAVVDVRPDASHQLVITYRALRDRGLLPGRVRTAHGSRPRASEDASFAITAPAAHRLWLLARMSLHAQRSGGSPYDLAYFLIEVIDPNGDGDWSDRVVRRLRLPASVPGFDGKPSEWWYGQPVSEAARGGAGSALLPAFRITDSRSGGRFSAFGLYRIADRNGDGDVLDDREVTKVYEGGQDVPGAAVASRPDLSDSGEPELVLGHSDRISLASAGGQVADIGRSFPNTLQLLAGPRGDIYAVEQVGGKEAQIFRLAPGRGRETESRALAVRPSALRIPHSDTSLLMVARAATNLDPMSTAWFRVDGSRAGAVAHRVGDICPSNDGHLAAFTSDATVAHEPFVYIASRGSGITREVTQRAAHPVCPFDGRHLVLSMAQYVGYSAVWTLSAYDVKTRALSPVVGGTRDFAMSPDGRELVYVERRPHGNSLVLVDLRSMRRTRLSRTTAASELSPFALWGGTRGDNLAWSPRGRRLVFVTGPQLTPRELGSSDGSTLWPRRRYVVWVTSSDGRRPRPILTIRGGPPTLSWSIDERKLLMCSAARGPYRGCQGTIIASPTRQGDESTLRLIDLSHRPRSRIVATGDIAFASWNPKHNGFAYADDLGLHFSSGRSLAGFAVNGDWVGWSPDGRYISMGEQDRYAIIDVATGKRRKVHVNTEGVGASGRWWP